MKLTQSEEILMRYLWKLKKAFMRDLLECYPDPKPASTTIATLLKRMQEKGYVGYKQLGNSRQYYPLVKMSVYFSKYVSNLIRKFFDDSPTQFASFFTSEMDLTESELKELQKIIEKELKKRQK